MANSTQKILQLYFPSKIHKGGNYRFFSCSPCKISNSFNLVKSIAKFHVSQYLRGNTCWWFNSDFRIPFTRGKHRNLVKKLVNSCQDILTSSGFICNFSEDLKYKIYKGHSFKICSTPEILQPTIKQFSCCTVELSKLC